MASLFTEVKNIIKYTKSNEEEHVKKIKASNNYIIYFLPVAYLLFLAISKLLNSYADITWIEIGIIFISIGLMCFIYNIISNKLLRILLPQKENNDQTIKLKNAVSTYFIFAPGNILVTSGFICFTFSLLVNIYAGLALFILIFLFLTGFYIINSWNLINNISNKSFVLKKAAFTLIILVGIIINPTVLLSIIPFKYGIVDIKITDKNDMLPTLGKRNAVIIDKISGLIKKPDYQEVVLIYYPEKEKNLAPFNSLVTDISNNDEKFFKRVIAKQGDSISITSESEVVLNNEKTNEPYLKETEDIICQLAFHCDVEEVDKNNYYLLGDNRNASQDSRIWSPVEKKHIKGKVFAKVWPLKDFKLLK